MACALSPSYPNFRTTRLNLSFTVVRAYLYPATDCVFCSVCSNFTVYPHVSEGDYPAHSCTPALLGAQAKMKKAAHERLQNTLAGVKQGAVSLWQRLQPYSFLLDGVDSDFLQRMKEKTDAGVQQDTVKALGLSETLLSMMLEVVSGTHDASTARFSGGAGGSNCGGGAGGASAGLNGGVGNLCGDAEDTSELSSTGNAPDNAGTIAEEVPPMRNNIRVRSIAYRVGAERLLEGGGDAGGQRWAGPSLVGHGGGGGGGGGGSGGGGGGGGTDVGTGLESDDEHAMEDVVPSRTFLKLCSSRQHTETIRKIESDERKKKLAERMETADETEKATLTSKLARKRQQDLAMVREQKGIGIPC